MIEIERKFLVISNDFINAAISDFPIIQGFLNSDPERAVRVRISGESAELTVKGMSSNDGLERFEWNTSIDKEDAEALIPLCETGLIRKRRYIVPNGKHQFEVDVFEGVNKGLIIAEIELNSPDESFSKPDWLGAEVTGQIQYYNSNLSRKPFSQWEE